MWIKSRTSDFLSQDIQAFGKFRDQDVDPRAGLVRLPPAGGTSALGMPKEQATNGREGTKKTGKYFNSLLSPLNFVSECGHMILVTVNNTIVWLFTHFTLVQPHLAAGEGADQQVDAGCYEAVVSHAVVHAVDSMRRVWAVKRTSSDHVPKIV